MRLDALEAVTNALVGLAVSWGLSWLVLGFTPSQAAWVTAMFFGASTVRQFALRRAFRRIGHA